MDDLSKIEYVTKIDFTKGFQRFHVKWQLSDLIRPKISSDFDTKVMDGQEDITLSWTLAICNDPSNPTDTGIFLLRSHGKMTPMVYHASLSSSTKVLFDRSDFRFSCGGYTAPSSVVDAYPVNNLVLQFWLDIPKSILIGDNSDKGAAIGKDSKDQDTLRKKNNDAFVLDIAKIFNRVTEAEATDSSSDVSIIIVKKVEELHDGQIINKEEEIRRFHCHTSFLSARSTVFERLFAEEKWEENCARNGRSVKIDDIDAPIMETVLRHIYTSALPDPSTEEAQLYEVIYAADKYNLTELKNWCVSILIVKYPSAKSRVDQLILADRHNLVQLKSVCLAQLSMSFHLAFSDQAVVKDIPADLWSEIMKAICERRATTTDIQLPAA